MPRHFLGNGRSELYSCCTYFPMTVIPHYFVTATVHLNDFTTRAFTWGLGNDKYMTTLRLPPAHDFHLIATAFTGEYNTTSTSQCHRRWDHLLPLSTLSSLLRLPLSFIPPLPFLALHKGVDIVRIPIGLGP